MNGYLTELVKLTKVSDPTADGTTAVDSAGVDMQANGGWDGVLFFSSFGTAAAGNLLKAQQSDDDGSTDAYSDLAGSEVNASGASDEDQWIDIQLPRKRYIRVEATRGTSSTLGDIWAILYRGKTLPVAKSVNLISGTIYGNQLYHPDEGTA